MGFGPVTNPAYAVFYASNTSISGQYLDVYGDNDTLWIDHSYVWGSGEKVTGNYNELWIESSTITGHDNRIRGDDNVLHGDHNNLGGSHSLVIGNGNAVHGNFNHVYGDHEEMSGDDNQVWGTDLAIFGDRNTITLQNSNNIDPAKISNYIIGQSNVISDLDNEKIIVSGDSNTLHISHSDTIWLAGDPKGTTGNEKNDTLDFSQAMSGKSDVYGFNATDTIVVGYGEKTTITTLADGSTNLHISGGGGASYDVVFHDGGADVAAHIVHAFFVV
jgi:hypothetical protein